MPMTVPPETSEVDLADKKVHSRPPYAGRISDMDVSHRVTLKLKVGCVFFHQSCHLYFVNPYVDSSSNLFRGDSTEKASSRFMGHPTRQTMVSVFLTTTFLVV